MGPLASVSCHTSGLARGVGGSQNFQRKNRNNQQFSRPQNTLVCLPTFLWKNPIVWQSPTPQGEEKYSALAGRTSRLYGKSYLSGTASSRDVAWDTGLWAWKRPTSTECYAVSILKLLAIVWYGAPHCHCSLGPANHRPVMDRVWVCVMNWEQQWGLLIQQNCFHCAKSNIHLLSTPLLQNYRVDSAVDPDCSTFHLTPPHDRGMAWRSLRGQGIRSHLWEHLWFSSIKPGSC
jgi:hypothetical protein